MLVVFDLDGTLIDSSAALLKAHEIAWTTLGLNVPAQDDIFALVGLPLRETMRRLDPHADADALAAAYTQAYARTADEHETLFAGVRTLLAHPFRAAVATGKSQKGAERTLKRHGLQHRFEVVLGGDAVPKPKPHPDLLQTIMTYTNTQELVMVGDTTFDLEMAKAAGVQSIGVAWGHHQVARLEPLAPVVQTVSELVERLGL